MKKIFLLIFIGIFLVGCAGWKVKIQNVDIDWIKDREWDKVIVGAASSFVVHEAAHYITAEAYGQNPKINSWFPMTMQYDEERLWVERSGFLAQIGLGVILNLLSPTKDSDFTLGFNTLTAAGAWTYHVRNKDESDFDSNNSEDWYWFTGISTVNDLWTINNMAPEEKNVRIDKGKIDN